MFANISYIYPSHPTMRNTSKKAYNCGGYALNLFKWYIPADSWLSYHEIEDLLANEDYETATTIAAEYMCKKLGYTFISSDKVFNHTIDYKKYEIVAFRYEMMKKNSDFHYMKIGRNGNWYEKRGWNPKIYRHRYYDVFKIWAHRYDGPIAFLIKERES